MLSSQAPGYAKTRRDARDIPQRDNCAHDAVPSQRRNPQPGAPVEAPLIDQPRQPYPPYTQYNHNYAGPPPSYHTNPSVTSLKTPHRKSHTAYPTPPDSPEYTTYLKVDQTEPERAASLTFDDVTSQPPQRMESTRSVQTVSTIRLEDLSILHPPPGPDSPRRNALVYDEAAYPTSFSPGRSPGAELARILATESVTTLPRYASMAPSDSDLAVHECSGSDVVADLDTARNTAADLWKRTIVCSKCNGTAVCGGNQANAI
ncbi:uncharacterized protein EV420DRAFT_1103835 [Desarmillaria tabescens]|uniref:Uncharacterized protein n=1 Tax=Armillaria tabescens TaxID=1929756 RepID=A0AA39NDX9_ARMTA|nr:uncharacterized protein EV420DRAFT_1103835 [Desarmillaria tabescens]KAK0463703.1 hypothetical protein EV420DRAFT_1103835 [Desarmillaria tabescens]